VSALGTVALAGRISTEISCGSVQCSGTVQLYAPGVAGKSTKASGHRPRAKYPSVGEKSPAMVLLGSAKYSLSPGSDKAIVLRLTPLGKHWLATARTHSPRAELKVIPTGGTASTTQIVVY
jgi:hypothetical protein